MRCSLSVVVLAWLHLGTGCTNEPPAIISATYFAGSATSTATISFDNETESPIPLSGVDEVSLRGEPVFDSVADIALTVSDLTFVLNGLTGEISAFRNEIPVLVHNAQGQGSGELLKPERLAWSEGLKRLYVFDSALSIIKMFELQDDERLVEVGLIETPFRVNGMCASAQNLLVHGYRPGMEEPGVLHRYTLEGEWQSSSWRMAFAPSYGEAVSFFDLEEDEVYAVVRFDNLDYKQLEEAANGGARYTDVPHSWRNMSLANFMDAYVVLNVVRTYSRGLRRCRRARHASALTSSGQNNIIARTAPSTIQLLEYIHL